MSDNKKDRKFSGAGKKSFKGKKNFKKEREDSGDLYAEGLSAVEEFIKAAPKKIEYIVSKGTDYDKVEALLKEHNSEQVKHHLHDEWFDSEKHISTPRAPVFAKVNIELLGEDNFFNDIVPKGNAGDLVLALDHVQDPHNFGAIARNAAFFGVKTILIPKARQVSLTKASVSTSQGAFAYLNVVQVSNLTRAIKKLKEEQYWALGADMHGESVEEVVGFYEKVVLVLGNEGKGLSRLVSENCDRIVSISREFGELESLNVSVAAGILIYRLSK